MDCLLALIDLKKCGNSGLIRISDLPFDYQQYADVSKQDSNTSSAEDVIEALARNTIRRITADIIDQVDIHLEDIATNCYGKLKDDPTTFSGINGISITLKPSKYLVLHIDTITIYSPIVQTVNLYLEDKFNTLWNQSVDLVVGANIVDVNQSFPSTNVERNFFIGYNQVLDAYGVSSGYSSSNCGCLDCCSCRCNGDTGGLILTYRMECSLEQMICKNAHLFDYAIINAFGVEYIHWNHGSFRMNVSKSKSKDHMAILLKNYEDNYQRALKSAIKRLSLCDDCCFKCTPIINSRYVCP